MIWLREKTDIVIPMGPFISNSDGISYMNGLTITQSDVRIYKRGSEAWTAKNSNVTAVFTEDGEYDVRLDVVDTNTRGFFHVFISMLGAYPVSAYFSVVLGHIYDLVITGSVTGDIISVLKGNPVLLSASRPSRTASRWR